MFLTIEGIEGSGKSTLITLLAREFESRSIPFLLTMEPGGSGLGKDLRRILLSQSSSLDDNAELFLFLADRAQHAAEIIRPALAGGQWVICDRYADSTVAYQGYGRGMDPAFLRNASDFAAKGMIPDITLLLDLPAEEGLRRARRRNGLMGTAESEGRFEAEEMAFHQRVRSGFLEIARLEPERVAVLDASQTPEDILNEAMKRLEPRMNATAPHALSRDNIF